nr:Ig-like domain-containing protein [Caldimonas sp.]
MSRTLRCRQPLRTAVCVACAAVALTLAMPSWSSHVGESLSADQAVVTATDQLVAAIGRWQRTPPSQRASQLASLVQLAQHRQEHLLQLLDQNATVGAARMLPQSLRAKLPPEAAAYVETEVRVSGTALAHVSDDFAGARSHLALKLHGDAGTATLQVQFADPSAVERDVHGMSGKRASLVAMRVGDRLVVLDKKQVQLEAAGGTSVTGTVVGAGSVVQGNQNTLSILVNFSDRLLTCTAADVSARLFGSTGATVNNNYRESSRGLVSFSGRAVGPFTINYSSTGSCDYSAWASAAEAAARAAGVDPSQYQRVNYVTPPNGTCGWSGLAYMPGRQSWVQACGATGVFSHELGHNLSLHHASTPGAEYGDGSDPMGGASVVDHNGANRVMAGWMPAGSVVDVTTGSSYALATVSTNAPAASPQVLRIAKPDTGEFYYVSLRERLNLDGNLGSGYVDVVTVHRSTGVLPTRTYLMQLLAAGQSFQDPTNGITVTNQGVAGGTATVGVSFSGGTCARSAPVLAVSPSSRTGAPGATVSYGITVSNRNSPACGTGTFNLAQALPAGFSGAFAATSLAIAAGGSASTTWSVTPSAQVAQATYGLDAAVSDAAVAGTVTAHATEIVYVDNSGPALAITSPVANSTVSGKVPITATASDSSGIRVVEFYVNGGQIGRDTGSPFAVTWNSRKATPGVYTIRVVATDGAGNRTEQSISVNVVK